MKKMISCLVASLLIGLNVFVSLGAIIEKSTIIVSNGTKTVTISTNGTILLNNVDITQVITNNVFPPLANTNSSSEGIRLIGAIGGYTLEEFIEDTSTRGPARDLPTFSYELNTTNLTVTWVDGDIYDPYTGYHHLDPGSKVLVNNAVNYAYWYSNDFKLVQWTTGSRPAADKIYLATFITSITNIIHAGITIPVGDELLYEDVAFANIMPSIITEGILCYATATNLTNIVLSGGVEYHNMGDRLVHDSISLAVTTQMFYYGHSAAGVWSKYTTNQFPVNVCDTGTVVSAMDPTMWYRGLFVAPHGYTNLVFILPDNIYTSSVDALAGADPDLPPGFDPYIPISTAYIYAGSDTCLRVESTYWQDDRFMIRRGARSTSIGGGGSTTTPTLQQVLTAGRDTGGLLPMGLGFPTEDSEAASKGYADSLRNKGTTGSAYVDPVNGDDITGRIEKGSLPFKTIQAAIDACAAVATDARRFLILISIGTYNEDVTMKNYIGIRGMDIESTIIRGQVTYPSTYDDVTGGEVTTLSIFATNEPAVVVDQGENNSYGGLRSCAVYSTWTNDAAIKPTIQISRGQFQVYGTTWIQGDYSGNGETNTTCLYYGTTNSANLGTYQLLDSAGYHVLNSTDTNDTICVAYSDAAQNNQILLLACETEIYINDSTNHVNKVKLAYQNGGNGSVDSKNSNPTVHLNATNNVILIAAASENTPSFRGGAGVHFDGGRIRAPNLNVGNAYHSSSPTAYDYAEVFWTAIAPQTSVYPVRYTADGSAGKSGYILGHNGGDILLGGGIDMSTDNPYSVTPAAGHGRWYTQVTSGFENPYWSDSSGLNLRGFRDNAKTMYNLSGSTIYRGQYVCYTQGISGAANAIALADNSGSWSNMAIGVVMSTNIVAGGKGRIMVSGRLEQGVDTSYMTAGDWLYLTTAGGITNVYPTSGFAQLVGQCNVVGVNGSIQVFCFRPDLLGNQLPSYYASNANLISETNRAIVSENLISNRVTVIEGRTSTWNQASVDGISATGRLVIVEGRTGTWNQASIDSTNAWISRVSGIEGRTGAWNTASLNAIDATNQIVYYHTAKRFKANIGRANITYATGPAVIPYTNVVLAASGGSIYSNGLTVCQWWPKATNGVVKLHGSWNAASANNATYKIHVYKNGALYADVYSWLCAINLGNNSMGSTWSFIDTATPTLNDYYQIENTFNSTRASLGSGTNNWVYGEVTSY